MLLNKDRTLIINDKTNIPATIIIEYNNETSITLCHIKNI
jgi:hypothetical protein